MFLCHMTFGFVKLFQKLILDNNNNKNEMYSRNYVWSCKYIEAYSHFYININIVVNGRASHKHHTEACKANMCFSAFNL